MLPVHTATRYVVPLREGGSLPAILETESGAPYVAKFRGAGQGARALVAEVIVGRLAQHLGLPVPEIVILELDESFGRSERDPEIQDVLAASRGINVGIGYLAGAFNYDPVAVDDVDAALAADIVWFDALVSNIDRTPRNPNIMYWNDGLWLIDHGAALYFHHSWETLDDDRARAPFRGIADHVLLGFAGDVGDADRRLAGRITDGVLEQTLADVPDALLMDAPRGTAPPFSTPEENRRAYLSYFRTRLSGERAFALEAEAARLRAKQQTPRPMGYRR